MGTGGLSLGVSSVVFRGLADSKTCWGGSSTLGDGASATSSIGLGVMTEVVVKTASRESDFAFFPFPSMSRVGGRRELLLPTVRREGLA